MTPNLEQGIRAGAVLLPLGLWAAGPQADVAAADEVSTASESSSDASRGASSDTSRKSGTSESFGSKQSARLPPPAGRGLARVDARGQDPGPVLADADKGAPELPRSVRDRRAGGVAQSAVARRLSAPIATTGSARATTESKLAPITEPGGTNAAQEIPTTATVPI